MSARERRKSQSESEREQGPGTRKNHSPGPGSLAEKPRRGIAGSFAAQALEASAQGSVPHGRGGPSAHMAR